LNLSTPLEILRALSHWFVRAAFGSRPWHGIELIAHPPYIMADLAEVAQALELIQSVDQKRLRRIKRHVRIVSLVGSKKVLSRFWPVFRACDLTKLPSIGQNRQFVIYLYAKQLVRESTYGFLGDLRFPGTKANRERMQRIASAEARRFLIKAIGKKRDIAGPFQEYLKILGSAFPNAQAS